MVSIGNFLFRYRNTLFPFALLFALLPGRRLADDPLDAAAVGLLVALVGQAVRIVTIGYEYIIRGGLNKRVYAEKLVTDGIYRLCRNPMYVGNLLIYSGASAASNSLTCILMVVPLFVFSYMAIVAAEEDYLRRGFGAAYEQYARDVPRWLPRLSALGDALRSGRFHWRRVLAKEFATPFGWISSMFVLLMFNLWRTGGFEQRGQTVRVLVIVYVVLAVVYLWVRHLKLSRRIVAD
jgi:protein-S-isoprenylcysteine O-methyltransferase Ste14